MQLTPDEAQIAANAVQAQAEHARAYARQLRDEGKPQDAKEVDNTATSHELLVLKLREMGSAS